MIKSRIPERLLDRVERRMKALLIINGQNIPDSEMKYLSKDSLESIQKIAPNAFLF